jgi:hypothetical protein
MPASVPTDIEKICGLEDALLRNLLITQRYHDLSRALREAIDTDPSAVDRASNANWSTFATWASRTAGETIRNEEVPHEAIQLIAEAEEVRMGLERVVRILRRLHLTKLDVPDVLAPIEKTIRDLSAQIAKGNLKVFAELAPLFAAFVDVLRAGDRGSLDRFLAKLTPGDVSKGGQDLLRSAFTGYFEARAEADETKRARILLACNCQIGLHEQTRLQPQIKAALDAPIEDVLHDGIRDSVRTLMPWMPKTIASVIAWPLRPMLRDVARAWRRVATRHLMNLTLPHGERLPLGEDLRASYGEPLFPPSLTSVDTPPDLAEIVKRFNRGAPRGNDDIDTGALDWANLPDRMNFILNLFRSRQQRDDLFEQPFTDDDRASIDRYVRPAEYEKTR